jgi:hypothetical protein
LGERPTGTVEAEEAGAMEDGSEQLQCALATNHGAVCVLDDEADLGDAGGAGSWRRLAVGTGDRNITWKR